MAEIYLTSSQLRSKKQELEEMNVQFLQTVESMDSTVETLGGSWEGETHDTFYNEFSKDKGQMNNFYNAVKNYCETLEQIVACYETTENANVSIASARNY